MVHHLISIGVPLQAVQNDLAPSHIAAQTCGRGRLVNSGQGRWVVRVSPRSGFSALAPPSQSFSEAMTEAHGADEFEAIMDSLRDSVEDGYSEIWTLMPDLSYIPEN